MSRLLRGTFAIVLALSLAGPPAYACCDDFWSCVGAVVTAGLSCAAEAALAILQSVIDKVVKAESDSSDVFRAELMKTDAEIRDQIAKTQTQLAQVDVEIKKVLADADKIYNEDQAAIRAALLSARGGQARAAMVSAGPTPTPRRGTVGKLGAEVSLPPGSSSAQRFAGLSAAVLAGLANDDSLPKLRAELDTLKREKEALEQKILKLQAQLLGQEQAAVDAANKAFSSSFLKPLDDALGSLRAALSNPLNVPGLADSVEKLLDLALKGLEDVVQNVVAGVAKVGDDVASQLQPPLAEIQKIVADAEATLAKMKKLSALRSAAERQALARAPTPGISSAALAPRAVKSPSNLKSVVAFETTARGLHAKIETLRPDVRRLAVRPTAIDVAPYRVRLAGEFDGFFRGKTPADAKKKHADLLLEARRRFASDPKILAAVEKYLNDEARARGVSL